MRFFEGRHSSNELFISTFCLCKFIVISLICFFPIGSKGQSLEDSIIEAIELSEEGKITEALQIYDQAIRTYGELPMLRVLKGEVFSGGGRRLTSNPEMYAAALREFNRAIELDSTFTPAYNSRALLNIFHQHFQEAIADFTRVLDLTEGDDEAQFNAYMDRGSAKNYVRDFNGAVMDYSMAIQLNPREVNLYTNLGAAFSSMGETGKAEAAYLKAFELDSINVGVLNNLGLHYTKSRKFPEAIALFKRAISLYPDEPLAYNNIGLALIKTKKPKEALEYINRSIEMYPENSYAFKHQGMALWALKQKGEACASWNRALALGYSKAYDDEVQEMIEKNCKRKDK